MIDETEETQLILFCEFVDSTELMETEKDHLLWIKGTTFELLFNNLYNPQSYNMYLMSFREDLGSENQFVNDT